MDFFLRNSLADKLIEFFSLNGLVQCILHLEFARFNNPLFFNIKKFIKNDNKLFLFILMINTYTMEKKFVNK